MLQTVFISVSYNCQFCKKIYLRFRSSWLKYCSSRSRLSY